MEIDLRQVMRALRRWGWMIVLLVVLGGGAGYGLAAMQSPTYSATTSLLVTAPLSTPLVQEGNRAETYRNLVESGPVLDRVIQELGLEEDRDELAEKIEATVVLNTQIIQISVSDESAERAANIANATARNFEDQVADLTLGQLEGNLQELQGEADELHQRQTGIDAELAQLNGDANAEDPEIQARIDSLTAERLRVSQTIADLDSSIRALNEQMVTATTPVAVADAATVAQEPDSPKPLLIGVLAAFLGGLTGIGLVGLLAFMDTRLRMAEDVEPITGARLLACVPEMPLVAGGELIVAAQPDAKATEAIRMVRAHLAQQVARANRHVFVFTSPRDEAPTSELVANLGVVMGKAGFHTTIVDADTRRPSQAGLFGLGSGDGATVLATNRTNLDVLPAGNQTDGASELVGSAAFVELVRRAREEADIVLVDAPGMLVQSDALSAASATDGVVLVVRSGKTDRDDLRDVAHMLADDDIPLIGSIVIGE